MFNMIFLASLASSTVKRGAAKSVFYGGTVKLFLLFLSILGGPAPKPPVLTSFEGKVILTVYFET